MSSTRVWRQHHRRAPRFIAPETEIRTGTGESFSEYTTRALKHKAPTATDDYEDGNDDARDEDDASLPAVMWGRSEPSAMAATSQQVAVLTRGSQARARHHATQPSLREPLRVFDEKIATLPVLREAIAAEYAGTRTTSGSQSARSASGSHRSASLSSVATTSGQSFSRSLLTRHCGTYLVSNLAEAQDTIGALRLELDLLRRINDQLANPKGTNADGEITPFTYTEENFQTLYLENAKLREILEANVRRYDEVCLALAQAQKAHKKEATTSEATKKELVALRTTNATLEQASANFQFQKAQFERSLAYAETQRTESQSEVIVLKERLQTLHAEHDLCGGFRTLVESERAEFRRTLEKERLELQKSQDEREKIATSKASLEGKLMVHYEAVNALKQELADLKREKVEAHSAQTSLLEQLSHARVQLVQTEGNYARVQRDLAMSDAQLTRVGEELARLRQTTAANEIAQTKTFDAMKSDHEATIAALRAQLAALEAQSQHAATTAASTIAQLQSTLASTTQQADLVAQENAALKKQASREHLKKEAEWKETHDTMAQEIARLKEELRQTTAREEDVKSAFLAFRASASRPSTRDRVANLRAPSPIESATTGASSETFADGATPRTGTPRGAHERTLTPFELEAMQDPVKVMQRLRELEVRVKETTAALEAQRRVHEKCAGKISRAELEAEREANLRRIQLKSAKEIRRRLESHVSVLDVRCAALAKALVNLGERGAKIVEKYGAGGSVGTTTNANISAADEAED